MMTQQFHLSWTDHGPNAAKAFHDLRADDHLCDVTIACEEGVFLGHKVVLFAASLLFRDILRKHAHPHPLIYLKNITSRDMVALLDFMYFGEVTLEKEQLSSFSAAAEELKVLGLVSTSNHVEDPSMGCFYTEPSQQCLQSAPSQPLGQQTSFSAAAEELKVLGLVNMSNHVEDPPKRCFAEPSQQCPQSAPSQPLGWQTPNDEVLQSPMDHQTTSASLPLKDSNYETKTKFEAMYETKSMFEATDSEVQPLPEVTDNSVMKENDQDHQQRISVSGQDFLRIKGKYLFLDSEYVFEATDSEERPLPEVKVNPAMKSNVRDNQQMISVCGQGFVRNRGEYAS